MSLASVVIPAHNEETVIARCLDTLLAGAADGEFEVVVVANGCTDATVTVARSYEPRVQVVDLDQPSKIAALNAGDGAVAAFPRIYLDADIEMGPDAVRAVARQLERPEVHCAAPSVRVELEGRPWIIRSFYGALHELPYFADGLVGTGVYALSAEGRSRFCEFPEITADDLFVRNLFTADECRVADDVTFTVHAPRTLTGLLAVRERVYRGNAEYEAAGFAHQRPSTFSALRILGLAVRRPVAVAAFIWVNVLAKARLRFRGARGGWERDESSRNPGSR